MKKLSKKTVGLALFSLAVLGAAPLSAQAAEVTQAKNTSTADITLEAGDTTAVTPILPTVPDGTTGNTGELTLDNITPFEFGKHKVTGGSETYSITATSANVQVSDRRGTGAGWELKVSAAAFKDKTEPTKVLKGAEVVIPAGTITSTDGNTSATPTATAVTLDTKVGNSQPLFQAEVNQGMGTWVSSFDPSEVKVIVPGGNFVGEYTSELTWTLGDTPQG